MLKEENKKKYTYIALFVFMLIFIILFRSNKTEFKYRSNEDVKEIIIKNINKITNNYSLEIELHKNEEEYKLEYMSDSTMKMYSSDTFPVTGYLIYDSKYYQLNNNELEKTKTIEINDIFNEKLYNMELIKNITNHCDINNKSLIRANCSVDLKNFFEEYNKLYNTDIVIPEEGTMNVEFLYDETRIKAVKIDYSNVINYLENANDKIIYDIDIVDTNKNDFSEFVSYIEKNN